MRTLNLIRPRFTALPDTFYSTVSPEPLGNPYWMAVNESLLKQFDMPSETFQTASNLAYLSGSAAEYQPQPIATVYSGHQFGGYTPRLGDGRALLLGEMADSDGLLWEWQLKGAGKTPYSRFADGRAVLRSSVREYLCSEAMHGLNIPTTRALALVGSQDQVYRETVETAAVVTRLAPSFIRFGHFEYFFYTGRETDLKMLADFVIDHYYSECRQAENPYLALLNAVGERTAAIVAAWQAVGFCHGVMNTDNMSMLGLTMDYGPFGFMEAFDRRHICNHSDHEGRYAYHAQPYIAHWNLAALANCFESLVSEEDLNAFLEQWPQVFQTAYLDKMRAKLGFLTEDQGDAQLVEDLLAALQDKKVDFTLFFRRLALVTNAHEDPMPSELMALFGEHHTQQFIRWAGRYRQRLRAENNHHVERQIRMNQVNPLYVLRNYLAQQAIELAQRGDYREIERLSRCLENPFVRRQEFAGFAEPAPEWAEGIAVSCSS